VLTKPCPCFLLLLLLVVLAVCVSVLQLAAEAKAAAMFAGQLGARDPTMCLPSHLEVIPECGAFTISVYAGQSLEQQLGPGGAVDLLSKEDRVEVARLVAAALMFVRHHNDTLVSEGDCC